MVKIKKNIYNAKTLLTGYKIGVQDDSLYVAVPKKYLTDNIVVIAGEQEMLIKDWKKDLVAEETFDDKFRPNTKYTLCYFRFNKEKEFRCSYCGELRRQRDASPVDKTACKFCR